MARKAKDPVRSAAQLRVMMRRWRQRAWMGVGLAFFSGAGIVACWYFDAHPFWWFVGVAGVVSALIEILADLNAYHDTRKRVAEIERGLDAHTA